MKRVLFIEPILAHYRRDTYRLIISNKEFDSFIIAGDNYESIKSADNIKLIKSSYVQFRLLNHRFYYLKNFFRLYRYVNPHIIVCSGIDFHLLHSVLLFVYVKLFTKVRFIWWSQGTMGHQGILGKWLRGLAYRKSDGIFAYSEEGKKNLIGIGVQNEKIVSVGNAINNDDYGFNKFYNQQFSEENKPFTILFTGRLTHAKRVDILLHSLKILNESSPQKYKCIIVGDGIIDELKVLSKRLGIENIVDFVGSKYDEEIAYFFQNSDIYVFPGGIGLSILHAFSYGLPVITTDNFDLHYPEIELLKPTENGDTFIDNNFVDLAQKIELWVKKIEIDKERISITCKHSIMEKEYMPDLQAKKIIEFLNKHS
ncbi:MAG: glycosyltransferase family 4 protein [Bacteroidales bacterium]